MSNLSQIAHFINATMTWTDICRPWREGERPSSCCRGRHWTSSVLNSGQQTYQIRTPSTRRSGESCSSVCINVVYVTSTSWSSTSLKCGMIGSRLSLTQLSAMQWRQQLKACERAQGRHFEHLAYCKKSGGMIRSTCSSVWWRRCPLDWIVQCFTSPPTQYRLYGRRFLQVKRPNQQYQNLQRKTQTTQRT